MESDFWWNWGVQFAVAVGTIGAVVVALFGDLLRPPKLRLSVDNLSGVLTPIQPNAADPGSAVTEARYYHVRVTNGRRWFTAHHVQVVLLQIQEPGPNNELQVKWSGEIPLSWENQQLYPVARTIGPEGNIDLCSVVKNKLLQLHPLMRPLRLQAHWLPPCNLTLTLQARADEGDSPPLRVRISWDGEWKDSPQEMRRHLTIETLSA